MKVRETFWCLIWLSALFILSITWHFETASFTDLARERHFGIFSVHVRLTVLEFARLEKKEEMKKERRVGFFKLFFLASINLT